MFPKFAAPRSERYWTIGKILGAVVLWSFGAMILTGFVNRLGDGLDFWLIAFGVMFSSLLFVVPVFGYYLRSRDDEIWCPRFAEVDGKPAIHFPGDERGMRAGAALYLLLGAALVCLELGATDDPTEPPWTLALPGLFFLSYTLFALLGRFREDGVLLTEDGVIIRARGLRALIPWNSIAGSRMYRKFPFPFHRIAIDLHPDAPREVFTTVPWWIGSPRPRENTVILTQVQVPGFSPYVDLSSPGVWINDVKQDVMSRDELAPGNAENLESTLAAFAPRRRRRHRPEV